MRKRNTLWALETALVISLTACSTPTNNTDGVVITDTPTVSTEDDSGGSSETEDTTGVSTSENDTSEVDETTTKPTSETTTTGSEAKTTGSDETKDTTAEVKKTTMADTEEDTTVAQKETTKAETVKETEQDPSPETPSGASTPETTVVPTTAVPETSTEKQTTTGAKKETTTAGTTAPTTQAPTTTVPTTATPTTAVKVTPVSITATVSGTHYIGDSLTGADFTVTVKMSDGSTLTNPAGFTATPLTLSGATNSITVAYNSVSTTITVKATEKPKETTQAPTTTAPTTTAPAPTTTPTTQAPATTEAQTTTATTNAPEVGAWWDEDDQAWYHTVTDLSGNKVDVMIKPDWWDEEWEDDSEWDTYLVNHNLMSYADYARKWEGLGTIDYEYSKAFFEEQNRVRVENGSPALVWSDKLYERAVYAATAAATGYTESGNLVHEYGTKYLACSRTDETGTYTTYIGENLYMGSKDATRAIQALYNSKGHKEQMLDKDNSIGAVAVITGLSPNKSSVVFIASFLYDDGKSGSYSTATCTYPY